MHQGLKGRRKGEWVMTWQWLRSLTETKRPVGSVNSCSNMPGSSKDSEGCEPGAEGCKLDVEWMSPAGKEVGEARRSNGVASIIFFLETWPPCRTKEITSSDAAEGTCSGSLLRLPFRMVGGRMVMRCKRRSVYGRACWDRIDAQLLNTIHWVIQVNLSVTMYMRYLLSLSHLMI